MKTLLIIVIGVLTAAGCYANIYPYKYGTTNNEGYFQFIINNPTGVNYNISFKGGGKGSFEPNTFSDPSGMTILPDSKPVDTKDSNEQHCYWKLSGAELNDTYSLSIAIFKYDNEPHKLADLKVVDASEHPGEVKGPHGLVYEMYNIEGNCQNANIYQEGNAIHIDILPGYSSEKIQF